MNLTMNIRIEDVSQPDLRDLLTFHLEKCFEASPPTSCHALKLDAFNSPDITLWTARTQDGDLLGCGALSDCGDRTGEIKSMHTAEAGRRQGVGSRILDLIIGAGRDRGYARLNLETGVQDYFAAARALYATRGFAECLPFGHYKLDPNSVFMTLVL